MPEFIEEPEEPEPQLPPVQAALEEIQAQGDAEKELYRSGDAFNYVIARVYKSRMLNKKVVMRPGFTNLVQKGTEQVKGRTVNRKEFFLYSYDEDIGPQEINIIGSRYI